MKYLLFALVLVGCTKVKQPNVNALGFELNHPYYCHTHASADKSFADSYDTVTFTTNNTVIVSKYQFTYSIVDSTLSITAALSIKGEYNGFGIIGLFPAIVSKNFTFHMKTLCCNTNYYGEITR